MYDSKQDTDKHTYRVQSLRMVRTEGGRNE